MPQLGSRVKYQNAGRTHFSRNGAPMAGVSANLAVSFGGFYCGPFAVSQRLSSARSEKSKTRYWDCRAHRRPRSRSTFRPGPVVAFSEMLQQDVHHVAKLCSSRPHSRSPERFQQAHYCCWSRIAFTSAGMPSRGVAFASGQQVHKVTRHVVYLARSATAHQATRCSSSYTKPSHFSGFVPASPVPPSNLANQKAR